MQPSLKSLSFQTMATKYAAASGIASLVPSPVYHPGLAAAAAAEPHAAERLARDMIVGVMLLAWIFHCPPTLPDRLPSRRRVRNEEEMDKREATAFFEVGDERRPMGEQYDPIRETGPFTRVSLHAAKVCGAFAAATAPRCLARGGSRVR